MSVATVNKPRARDRQATKDALMAAAVTVIAECGYEGATTRAIADAAGCSESLIQRYFNGKEGLLLAILDKEEDRSDAALFLGRPLCSSLAQEAREMLAHSVEKISERSDRIRIVISRALLDEAFKARFNRIWIREDVKSGLESRLARYVYAGMADPDLDIGAAAEMLLGLSFELGFIHRELLQTSPDRTNRLLEQFAEMFGRAISAPLSTARSVAEPGDAPH
ncbi:TetR/AcrR family transcriptional regulator [Methylosinus sp. C49]|uniref:TetR/AcrR family transcriptional regulator n=1 Tax=Methylosinus sp. C49 TaxID=2699395 RepID=UPI001FCE5B27|nr:TetR/AcrR family transcriptional regulator [Methylosinus sp. C49]